MKPINLEISAFGPYKNKVEIDFTKIGDNGIFLITGDTGAGKTSIFDAISFALFGEVSGSNRTIQSLRSNFAEIDTKTYVKLKFSHKNKIYFIERNPEYERPLKRGVGTTKETADATLDCEGEFEPITGTKNVNNKIEEILGINSKQFKQISMLAQGEFLKVLFAESKERTEIFRKIFDTNIYKKITNEIFEEYKKSNEELSRLRSVFEGQVALINWKNTEEEITLLNKIFLSDIQNVIEKLEKEIEIDNKNCKLIEEEITKQEKNKEQKSKNLDKNIEYNKNVELYFKLLKEREELSKQKEEIEYISNAIKQNQKLLIEVKPLENIVISNKTNIKKIEAELLYLKTDFEKFEINKKDINMKTKNIEKLEDLFQKYSKEKQIKIELISIIKKINEIENDVKEEKNEKIKYEDIQNKYIDLNKEYEEKEDEYFKEQVGIIAEKLEENKPCPVCGSIEHPIIAQKSEKVLTKDELDKLKIKVEELRNKRDKQRVKVAELIAQKEKSIKDLNELNEGNFNFEGYSKDINKKYEEVNTEIKNLQEEINNIYFLLINNKKNVKLNLDDFEFETFKKDILDEIKENEIQEAKTKTKIDEKEKLLQEKEKEQLESNKNFIKKYKELGYETEENYKLAILSKEKENDYNIEIEKYNKDVYTNNIKIRELEEKKIDEKSVLINLDEFKNELDKIEEDLLNKRKIQIKENNVYIKNQEIKEKLQVNEEKFKKVVSQNTILEDLYYIASGRMPGKRKIEFEQYVQTTYFDMIISEANKRLIKMTDSRFYLVRREIPEKASEKVALELDVMDNYNGKKRDVKSLSGGESFKAALSLALGLSDVIQSYSGGVVIDTLFVDEGFGSLDTESREQAIKTLLELSDNNKLIGIISHVTELKEIIEKKIIVSKDTEGSSITIE